MKLYPGPSSAITNIKTKRNKITIGESVENEEKQRLMFKAC